LATMIPNYGPATSNSRAEQLIYPLLCSQLGAEFTVIHSLPWLGSAVREIAGVKAVTGEIDFLVIHPDLGVLAIEVKGGAHKVQGLAFVHVNTGTVTRVVEQIRANTHGLARWLGVKPGLRLKIGYALVFPHSDFKDQLIGLALADLTVDPPVSIVIDRRGLANIGQRITEIMTYWKAALSVPVLGKERVRELLSTICPSFDGTPAWGARVLWDEKVWLRLTPEQSAVVDVVLSGGRIVVTGWPGTGKTLILIESARRLLKEGKKVLILTFNALLAQFIREQMGENKLLKVSTWHSLCRSMARQNQRTIDDGDKEWLEHGCIEGLQDAISRKALNRFDALLLDEAQTFRVEWIDWLCTWHSADRLLAFCDETQVFSFEKDRVSLRKLCELVGVSNPFTLTVAFRSPQAVYNRLKSVKKADYQIHMPRDLDVDGLKEILVLGMHEAVSQILSTLAEQDVACADIVVLTRFGHAFGNEGTAVRCQTLSRFRGMESPIVVIPYAEQMDDAELFCAYSRATTLCVAFYDAEILGVRGAACDFQKIIMTEPRNLEKAESARLRAQTGEILRSNFLPFWCGLDTVELGWLEDWGAWIVVMSGPWSQFWIDYLSSHYHWPIFCWKESSLREVRLTMPVNDIMGNMREETSLRVNECQECSIFTPHRFNVHNNDVVRKCVFCATVSTVAREAPPNKEVFDHFRKLDILLNQNPKSLEELERKSLPLSLAAAAALLFAGRQVRRDMVMFERVAEMRITYYAALGFVYSLINLMPPSGRIKCAKIAEDLYNRYLIPEELTLSLWKRDFALACNTAYQKGHLKKLVKGVYALSLSSAILGVD